MTVGALRLAVPLDAEQIGVAHAEAWRVGYEGLFPAELLDPAVERRRRMWGDYMAEVTQQGELWIAEDAGDVLGFIHFGPSSTGASQGEVYGLYVQPSHWGAGTAQALMEKALRSMAGDFTGAFLWTHAGAGRARSFYAKAGWSETGNRRTETLWDGLVYPAVEYEHHLEHQRSALQN